MNNSLFQQQTLSDMPVFTDTALLVDATDLKSKVQLAQDTLKDFIMPLSYDGSEAIHSALQQFLTHLLHIVSATPSGQFQTVIVQDMPNQLLENIYFYYKRSQTNNMKISATLQNILVQQLAISQLDIQQAVDNYDRVARFMLGKACVQVIKDELIETVFWTRAGAEAHVMLRLLEAKAVFQRRGFGVWHKQLVSADSCGYQQEIEQIMLQISKIRLNQMLSNNQRKQAILDVLRQYQSQDVAVTASNLETLLIEAERHVNDYYL